MLLALSSSLVTRISRPFAAKLLPSQAVPHPHPWGGFSYCRCRTWYLSLLNFTMFLSVHSCRALWTAALPSRTSTASPPVWCHLRTA